MKRNPRRLPSLTLCALLLLGLSACQLGATTEDYSYEELLTLSEWEVKRAPVAFDQMDCPPPDMDELDAQIDLLIGGMEAAESLPAAFTFMMQAKNVLDEYDTLYVLSEFYYDWDQSDEEALARMEFYQDNYGSTELWWDRVYTAIENGPYAESLLPIWNPYEMEPVRRDYNSFRSASLWEEIDALSEQADEILSSATVRWEGETVNLQDCFAQWDWEAAASVWLGEHGPALLDLYVTQVQARSDLARECYRIDNFTQYIFEEYQWEYSPDMVEALIGDIVAQFLPLDTALTEDGHWDILYSNYGDKETFIETAGPILSQMDAAMGEAFQMMLDYDLWQSEGTDYTVDRPYATYLPMYRVPIMLCPYYDDIFSVLDFTHEFGHFYEYYVSMDAYSWATDLSEIHSQAMSLLYAEAQGQFSGDDSLVEMALVNTVDTLVYQCVNADIELAVYDLPREEITRESLMAIGREVNARFDYSDETQELQDYYWLTDVELFTKPFEPFSYVGSAAAALELWKVSREDMDDALLKYDILIHHVRSEELLDNLRWADLPSPFDAGWAQETSQLISDQLQVVVDTQADAA